MDADTMIKEFKTISAYGKAERINNICEMIEKMQEETHEDDDLTHDCLQTALNALEEIPMYDGYGNKY